MKLLILLVLFSFCNCSDFYGITPVSYESKLDKHSNHYDDQKHVKAYSDPRNHGSYERNHKYDDRLQSSYDEDEAIISRAYEKNIHGQRHGNSYGGDKYRRRQKRETEEVTNERLDKIFGYTGPTANDEPENLVRPCALDDWQCIRKYFAANGKCKPSYGPIPDPLTIDLTTIFFSAVNITASLPITQLRGLSSVKVKEFYVNKKSGNLVFVIDVENLNQTIPRAYFRYRRMGKEPIILADYGTVNFRAATFTAIIPKVPDLRLDQAEIHADVQDGVPKFFIGPGAFNSSDIDVVTGFIDFTENLSTTVREGFLFQSQLWTSIYIQKNICDFGLTLISV